jgi:GntR family transcriptional regulator/MocR family aminotransferase
MGQNKSFELRSLRLDQHSQTPFYRQVYERIRDAIAAGILRPTERLPSTRSLASQLATARGTIDLAYSLLSAEGYILSRGAGGTFVAPALSGLVKPAAMKDSSSVRSTAQMTAENVAILPFQMGLPALDAFPSKLWSRLAIRRARTLSIQAMSAPDPTGYAPLRSAITSYLAVSRGILCSAEQVIITSGFQSALGLITRTFLQPGDAVWFEDPGYFMARRGLEAAGARLVPVAVDAEGMNVAAGTRRAPRARFAYVTPSHQAPLGVALSLPRRLALLAWATKAGAWIIEDDYDSEFRYGSRPLPALKSLDESARVLYVGSFSKVLFPGVRLGYLVVPHAQIERVGRICRLLYRDRPIFNQAVVADFMIEGHFARHIKRMRALYEERRAALAEALTDIFRGKLLIQLQAGGMHLLARFADSRSDLDLVTRANSGGLAPAAFSPWGMELPRAEQGLLLSFTNMPQESAKEMARRLKAVL